MSQRIPRELLAFSLSGNTEKLGSSTRNASAEGWMNFARESEDKQAKGKSFLLFHVLSCGLPPNSVTQI